MSLGGKLLAVVVCAVGGSMVAQTPTAAALAKMVDAHYNHLQSLEARYTER